MNNLKSIDKIKTVAIHDGKFHADDVFAVAALLLVNPNLVITRTRNKEELEKVDLRVDVGFVLNPESGDFDHHQGEILRENNYPYAAFGLIWKSYGSVVCERVIKNSKIDPEFLEELNTHFNYKKLAQELDNHFVKAIDYLDNFGPHAIRQEPIYINTIPDIVATFNSPFFLSVESEPFNDAVEFAKGELKRVIQSHCARFLADDIWAEALEKSDDFYVVLEHSKHIPKSEILKKSDKLFSIQKYDDKKWSASALENEDGTIVNPFPKEWIGLRDAELEKVTGVKGAIFCFKGISVVADSKEAVIELVKRAKHLGF